MLLKVVFLGLFLNVYGMEKPVLTGRVFMSQETPALKDKISGDGLLDKVTINNEVGCARRCSRTIGCTSFFYNMNTEACQLHGEELNTTTASLYSESPGNHHYNMKQQDMDDCAANPCQNGGVCRDLGNGYNCTCAVGYKGRRCEINIDDCVASSCQNGGVCNDLVNDYNCTCAAGFIGTVCEININECASNPCPTNGLCEDLVDGYQCLCVARLEGKLREINIPPVDCYDILLEGKNVSGVYKIFRRGVAKQVYCDQDTDGGGWLVIQRRRDGSENFYREWNDYEQGFGNLENEFWIGNAFLASITSIGDYTLRVDLENFKSERRCAVYNSFSLGSDSTKYKLNIGGYIGTAGDSLKYHNGHTFQTKGQSACVTISRGGWWYDNCFQSNLNGIYFNPTSDGVYWNHWLGWIRLKKTDMKIRPTKN